MAFNVDSKTIDKETDGVWVKFQGSQIKVASTGSIRFQRKFSALQRPYHKKIDKGTLDPKIQLDIMSEAMANALVLDWKNVVDSNKKQVPFSEEIAYNALRSNSEFRDFIYESASDLENFKSEIKEDIVKP